MRSKILVTTTETRSITDYSTQATVATLSNILNSTQSNRFNRTIPPTTFTAITTVANSAVTNTRQYYTASSPRKIETSTNYITSNLRYSSVSSKALNTLPRVTKEPATSLASTPLASVPQISFLIRNHTADHNYTNPSTKMGPYGISSTPTTVIRTMQLSEAAISEKLHTISNLESTRQMLSTAEIETSTGKHFNTRPTSISNMTTARNSEIRNTKKIHTMTD